MKTTRPAGSYYNEKSCIEDVLAIAQEIAQGTAPAKALNTSKSGVLRQPAKRSSGVH